MNHDWKYYLSYTALYVVIFGSLYWIIYYIWGYPTRPCKVVNKELSTPTKLVTDPGHYENGICVKDKSSIGINQSCPPGQEYVSGQGFTGCRDIVKPKAQG